MGLRLAGRMRDAAEARADGAAVGLHADQLDLQPIVLRRQIAAEKLRIIVDGVDYDVEIAVIVEIAEGAAARGDGNGDAGAGLAGDVGEAAVAEIFVEQLLLRVAGFGLELLDLGIDVTVADENVGPAVVVHVEKAAAPAEILRVRAESGGESGVLEIGAAEIAIERGRVAGEIGFDDVEIAVEIVIDSGDAHAGLGLAVGREGAAGLDGDVRERAVLFVLIERAGLRVVGDVDVGPAVVVEIGGENAEAEGAVGLQNTRGFGDIGEGAIAVVVIEDIFAARQAGRAAGDHDAFVEAGAGFGNGRRGEVEVNVIGDEEIEAAVAVVVHEGAAGVPALAIACDAGLGADVGEGAIAVVVVETVFAEVGDEEVVEAVVVVIADANALSPAGMNEAGFDGDIGEGGVAIVFEEAIGGRAARRKTFEASAGDEKNVEPAVVVVVVEGDAAAGGFEQIFVFVFATENCFGVEAGFAGDVEKADAERIRRRGWSALMSWRVAAKEGGEGGRARERENVFKRQNQRGTAERLEKRAARREQKVGTCPESCCAKIPRLS